MKRFWVPRSVPVLRRFGVTVFACGLLGAMPLPLRGGGFDPAPPNVGATAAPPTAFDSAWFNALEEPQRLQFVIERLREHDRHTENFSCKVVETTENRHASGGGSWFICRHDCEFRRLGDKYWLKQMGYEFRRKDPIVRHASVMSWDGSAFRITTAPEDEDATPYFRITPTDESDRFPERYLEAIGFRMTERRGLSPGIGQFLSPGFDPNRQTSITAGRFDGTNGIGIRMSNVAGTSWELWIDPSRDYLIWHTDRKSQHRPRFIEAVTDVRSAEHVAGTWVPRKVVSVVTSSDIEPQSQITCDATSIALGNVREEDLRVADPKDARVYDEMRNVAYEPLPDGRFKLLPFDTQGVEHVPPRTPVDRIDEQTQKLYVLRPVGRG